jgi:hypothetical protein
MGIYPIFRHTHMGDNRNPGECHVKLTTSTPQASPAPRPVAAWRATRGRRCPWPVPSYMRRRWGSIPGSDRVTGIAVPISCTSHRACWICDNQLLGILICINTIRICHLQEILFWGDVKKSKKKKGTCPGSGFCSLGPFLVEAWFWAWNMGRASPQWIWGMFCAGKLLVTLSYPKMCSWYSLSHWLNVRIPQPLA